MARRYRHKQQYEKELFELKTEWESVKEIDEKLGLTYEQLHEFFKRNNQK